MKKVFFSFLLLLFCTGKIVAQADSQISQYTFFPAAFNPAMVGETGFIQIVGLHQMDYLTFSNGKQTTNFGVNMPFTIGKSSHGAGIRFVNIVQGSIWAHQNAYLQYAYKRNTSIGKFSFGIDVGFINTAVDGTKAVTNPKPDTGTGAGEGTGTSGQDGYHEDNDTAVPATETSGMKLDLNVGAIYSFKNGYAGVSLTHLTSPDMSINEGTNDNKVVRVLYIIGAYDIAIPDTKLVIKPSTLFKTEFITLDWSLAARLEYNEKFWGGLSYRIGNTVGVNAGINILGGLSAGVAYDLPVNKRILSGGSFELVLEYNFEYVFNKHTKKYKSIRIL